MHTNVLIITMKVKKKKKRNPYPKEKSHTSFDTIEQTSLIQPCAQASSSSSSEGFHGVLGVDLVEQGEVGREPLLAETDARQRLLHLLEQDLVTCRREVEPVAASWYPSKCYPRLELVNNNTLINRTVMHPLPI